MHFCAAQVRGVRTGVKRVFNHTFLDRYSKANLRQIIRGYKRYAADDRLDIFREIAVELCKTQFSKIETDAAPNFFGVTGEKAELATRQFLVSKRLGLILNREILRGTTQAPASVTLPSSWCNEIRGRGIALSSFKSWAKWSAFVLACFGFGIVVGIKFLFLRNNTVAKDRENCAYVYGMLPGSILPGPASAPLDNFGNWYRRSEQLRPAIKNVFHNVKTASPFVSEGIKFLPQVARVPALPTFSLRMKFLCWFLCATVIAAIKLCQGRWWYPLMLSEAVYRKVMALQPQKFTPEQLVFNNSDLVYQPLFALEAQAKGAEVLFNFYSVNTELIPAKGQSAQDAPGWAIMSWPKYVVWTSAHQKYLDSYNPTSAAYVLSGPTPFVDVEGDLPAITGPKIAVFDMTGFRQSVYVTLGQPAEFYTEAHILKFWTQLAQSAQELGVTLLVKKKRRLGHKYVRSGFGISLRELLSKDVVEIDEGVSPARLIDHCDASVSIPFTSTGVIGLDKGKPSVYFDPSGWLNGPLKMDHGVPIITDKERLKEWMKGLVKR